MNAILDPIRAGAFLACALLCSAAQDPARPPTQQAPSPSAKPAAADPALRFDHLWIVVSPGGPEREVLARAGLRVAPTVYRHEGQGTASVMVEFEGSFLELIWPDPSVPIAPGAERGAEKFKKRMEWRTNGWCPFGVGTRRTPSTPKPLPVATWSITAAWLREGTAIEMLTPRDDTSSPSLFISPDYLALDTTLNPEAQKEIDALAAERVHPLGVHRITRVRLVSPAAYRPIEALEYFREIGIVEHKAGEAWIVEVVLDDEKQGKQKDLRPELPLVLRY